MNVREGLKTLAPKMQSFFRGVALPSLMERRVVRLHSRLNQKLAYTYKSEGMRGKKPNKTCDKIARFSFQIV